MKSLPDEFEFKLTKAELAGSTWIKTQKLFEYLLDRERKKNDTSSLTAEQTAAVRGKIGLLKEFIRLNEELRVKKEDEDELV